ncbi:UDP-N-acetylmuramoylalanyl-D-glutamyl-2,6-diaminopimelate--D-alanyl-D-alanine ligase [Telmatospirillum siberiense]|uniref:UDP-N-acetylmuramoyl-tripeptide--D-alanyl-D-alanine ligase n=1 Tax=Telmatospirillum siberiense TaxID=382514 RepID=A0A2N3PQM0_9PROT|nr:UDP-N-acetylmuramoylalanyl-D-glutamyl-2,6-diaminopimelate--D-alanyl-D-alanine ligase [Telmatospirillum siberiense]PKU22684.1 UDP-N-acetylmuramoylalanyl-D-glutamyl-2, 6-diaminopimelate--D-alanyl-D-alanine ligase [Telmatospirillum siberiense]
MSAILWTSEEAAEATGGRLGGTPWQATDVSIDSRSVQPGALFVALAGPNHDGHDHVAAALAKGAAAALVHRIPADAPKDAPLLLVEDSMAGLSALAGAARARSNARIVAVTGSVGKTGTKEMLKLALEATGPTHVSQGNLNNHWGVPLSLSRLPREALFGVFELGMNHAGEITPLTRLVRPHVAVVTSVEAVHMAHFASTREIAEAKAEIFLGVEPDGFAVLPRDNPHYRLLFDAARRAGITNIISFGSHIDAGARLLDGAIDPSATLVLALFGDDAISYRVGVPGLQWASNSLAALLAARAAGADLDRAARSLSSMSAPKGRGARRTLPWGGGKIEIIDESYNASPVSVRAAILTLAAAERPRGARRIAVLGDMLELGQDSPVLHGALAQTLVENRIDLVYTAGPLMRHLHEALPQDRRGGHAADADEAALQLVKALKPGDVIMVKGSAGSVMGRVIKALEQTAAPEASPEGCCEEKP